MLRDMWGFDLKVEYIRSIFRHWRWSWKKPSRSQLEKYTDSNVEHYINFVLWVKEVPLEKLKFLDEGNVFFLYFFFFLPRLYKVTLCPVICLDKLL